MFPTAATNGHQQHTADTHTSLADIVRQETQDGRLIIRFLVSAMQGHVGGAKPCHRLDAARLLIRLGCDDARAFVAANTRATHPTAPSPAPSNGARPEPDQQLADIVRQETSNGRDAVRFLVDVMQGKLPGFKPRHRLYAAKELLHRLSAIEAEAPVSDHDGGEPDYDRQTTTTPRHSRGSGSPGGTGRPAPQAGDPVSDHDHDGGEPDYDDDDEYGDRHDPAPDNNVSYDTYGYEDYRRDSYGYQAQLNIFGSDEAVGAAKMAVFNFRHMGAGQADRDAVQAGQLRPPDPQDEPYGFKAITYIYGEDREAAAVAYRGANEYLRQKELAQTSDLQSDDDGPGGPDDHIVWQASGRPDDDTIWQASDSPDDSPDPPPPEPPGETSASPSPNEPSPRELRALERDPDLFGHDPYYA